RGRAAEPLLQPRDGCVPERRHLNRFEDLSLAPALLAAVRDAGFTAPTTIQAQAIPLALAGRDVLGCAQTGTGKTAAFALPIVQRLLAAPPPDAGTRPIRALVLSPTRELATQIGDAFAAFGDRLGIRHAVVYGGVSDGPQRRALRRGADVLVATPGRLEDLRQAGEIDLRRVRVAVLDEADRMLDRGFVAAVRRILAATPRERQTLLFSATMPPENRALARSVPRDAAAVSAAPVAPPADRDARAGLHAHEARSRPGREAPLGARARGRHPRRPLAGPARARARRLPARRHARAGRHRRRRARHRRRRRDARDQLRAARRRGEL